MKTYLQISAVIICSLFSAVSVAGWFTDVSDDLLSSQRCELIMNGRTTSVTLTEEGYLIYKAPAFKLEKVSEDMIFVTRLSDGDKFYLPVETDGSYVVSKSKGKIWLRCFD